MMRNRWTSMSTALPSVITPRKRCSYFKVLNHLWMTPLVWGDRTWVRTCRSSGSGPSNAVLNTSSGTRRCMPAVPELIAVAVWTWVFSDRTAGESVQVVYPAAAMQLSYLGRLQSGVGQSDHRAVVGWLELDCDDRGSGRDRNCVSFPAPGEDDSAWRHDLEEVSRCGSRVRHDHAQCAAGACVDASAHTLPCSPAFDVGEECEYRWGRGGDPAGEDDVAHRDSSSSASVASRSS